MSPIKFFNFALPFGTYQELKRMSHKAGRSIADIVREAIDDFLKKSKSKGCQNECNP